MRKLILPPHVRLRNEPPRPPRRPRRSRGGRGTSPLPRAGAARVDDARRRARSGSSAPRRLPSHVGRDSLPLAGRRRIAASPPRAASACARAVPPRRSSTMPARSSTSIAASRSPRATPLPSQALVELADRRGRGAAAPRGDARPPPTGAGPAAARGAAAGRAPPRPGAPTVRPPRRAGRASARRRGRPAPVRPAPRTRAVTPSPRPALPSVAPTFTSSMRRRPFEGAASARERQQPRRTTWSAPSCAWIPRGSAGPRRGARAGTRSRSGALAEPLVAEAEVRAGLRDDLPVEAGVEHRALPGDPGAVDDVELGLLERRRDLVLDHLDADAVADRLDAVLERLDPADVEPHRRVELERAAARASSRGCRT